MDQNTTLVLTLLAALLIIRAGEYRLHRSQRRFLDYTGGQEVGRGWMSAYYALEGIALAIMCLELFLVPKETLPLWQRLVGLVFLTSGGALRLWARQTVGRTWSLMLVYVPDIPRVASGPYRYFSHPEYFSRFLELFGFCLFFASYYGFGIYLAGTMMILPQIMILERRQLSQLSKDPEE